MVPANNTLGTQPLQISALVATSGTVFLITTVLPHQLSNGEAVTISGVLGTIGANANISTTVRSTNGSNQFTILVGTTAGVYTANSGQVVTASTLLNYWHLLAVKCKYVQPDYTWSIVSMTGNAIPIVVTINTFNAYRTGDQVTITGSIGNTNANGTFYIKKLNSYNIQLFSDINLQAPVLGNAAWSSGGTLSKIYYKYAFPYISEQKISSITVPTTQLPAFEVANNVINLYPMAPACVETTVDYITKPPVTITSTDNVIDLELYYPLDFLAYVLDTATQLFSEQVRDRENVEFQATEKAQNN